MRGDGMSEETNKTLFRYERLPGGGVMQILVRQEEQKNENKARDVQNEEPQVFKVKAR